MTDRVVKLETANEAREIASFDGLQVLASVAVDTRAHLERAFQTIDGVDCVYAEEEGGPAAALLAAKIRPHVYLFEATTVDEAVDALDAIRSGGVGGDVQVCALLRNDSKAATVRLLREGANDVFTTQPTDLDLTRCLARAARPTIADADDHQTRVITFMHASGGVGTTTLAVNTALLLQSRIEAGEGGVCLIDFDLQFGDVDLHLDLADRSRILEIVKAPERLDQRMLEELMAEGPNGLRVLTAPDRPLPLDLLTPATFERIVSLARRNYRYVVIDMPLALSAWTDVIVNKSDKVFLVTEVNVPALRSCRRLIDAMREENVSMDKVGVIANRYSEKKFFGRQITLKRAENALKAPIVATLPSDFPLMIESVDQGSPAAVSKPGSKYIEAINAVLDASVDHKVDVKSRGGFLKLGK